MANSKKRAPRLGRGLSSLIAQPVPAEPVAVATLDDGSAAPAAQLSGTNRGLAVNAPADTSLSTPGSPNEGLVYIDVTRITPNQRQPRRQFDQTSLQDLAESINADGLMQPVIVRPSSGSNDGDSSFEMVAGERRWRAARLAGLTRIPAVVRELDDQQMTEWALIENLQREDLNPIERAEAFSRLASEFGLSHEAIASRLGLNRSSVSNLFRLLLLCDFVQQLVRDGLLSMGQARAIAGLSDPAQQQHLAQQAIKQAWSVRQVERAVRQLGAGSASVAAATTPATAARPSHLADLEQQIAQQLQTRVKLRPGRKKGSGTLSIEFFSLDQFDSLLTRLGVEMQ